MSDRTTAYQFTTEDRNDPRISELKKGIAAINKMNREEYRRGYSKTIQLYRVRLMPRGSRVGPSYADYNRRRAYDSYLPIRHGSRFDVYIHRDTSQEYVLTRERETGLTPGQQRQLAKEEHAHIIAGVEMHQRLREAGIHLGMNGEYMSRENRIQEMRDRGLSETMIERLV